jgi:hypothetical protein
MRNRETQVRNARIEIVIEASDRAGSCALQVLPNSSAANSAIFELLA